MKRTKGKFVLSAAILGWLILTAGPSYAAHPLVTDDAGTVGAGSVQIEATGEFGRDKETADDGTALESRTNEAALTLTYGLTQDLDFVVAAPYQWFSVYENDALTGRENGLSDMGLDLKWRFFEKDGWALALKPGVTLPTGDDEKGLGSGRAGYRLFFISTREMEPWAFHLNLGYIRNENRAGDRKDLWHASVAAEVGLIEHLKAVANVGIETNPAVGTSIDPAFALGGLIYELSEKVSLDAGVKFGLTEPETDVSYLVGLTFKF
ncbi:MAG: transporter [Deltaproteobacteria bacterium]|nr:transporter [Deltaproteobacteria bacterium]